MEIQKVNVKVKPELRNKLIAKKYLLRTDSLDSVIQRMYNLMNKLKLWEELK